MTTKASKALLITYALILIWVILFKYPISLQPVLDIMLSENPIRRANWIPFVATLEGTEVLFNLLIYMPLGAFLGMAFPQKKWLFLILYAFIFITVIEILQYVTALGLFDTADIIVNILGVFIGLRIYLSWKKFSSKENLDSILVVLGFVVCAVVVTGALYMAIVRGYHVMPLT